MALEDPEWPWRAPRGGGSICQRLRGTPEWFRAYCKPLRARRALKGPKCRQWPYGAIKGHEGLLGGGKGARDHAEEAIAPLTRFNAADGYTLEVYCTCLARTAFFNYWTVKSATQSNGRMPRGRLCWSGGFAQRESERRKTTPHYKTMRGAKPLYYLPRAENLLRLGCLASSPYSAE